MTNADGIRPAPDEITQQLEKVLAHPLFQGRPKQADVLDFLVRGALTGAVITGKAILEGVFPNPPYKHHVPHVRKNMTELRKTVRAYYTEHGEDDPVIISLPNPEEHTAGGKLIKFRPGEAYTPRFRYNPRSEFAMRLAIANHLLRGGPSQIDAAMKRFGGLLELSPNHPDVILGMTEAFGQQLLLGVYDDDLRESFAIAGLACIDGLGKDAAAYWRSHNVRGLLHTSAGNLEEARKSFDKALKLDRQSTLRRGHYTNYLFAVGQQDDAVRQMGLQADEDIDNPSAHAMHGIYLCNANRFKEAEHAFDAALTLDRNCWPAIYGVMLLLVLTGRQADTMAASKRLEALLEPVDFERCMKKLGLAEPVAQLTLPAGGEDSAK